jgi:hypothetical protein
MRRSFLIKHWLTTLILAPFLPSLYDLFFPSIKGQVISLLELYPVTVLMSLFFSLPTFALYYFLFVLLDRKNVSPLVAKILLISISMVGITITFLLIGGSYSIVSMIAYSVSVLISGLLYRLKK